MSRFRLSPPLAAALAAIWLAACSTSGFGPSSPVAPEPAPVPDLPSSYRPSEFVGVWGYASYTKPEDRPRIEKEARAQCSKPFKIAMGPNGGLMMHVADQREPQEVVLKGGPGGKNYIGPAGPAGGAQDLEVESFSGRVLVARYVDPEVASRYGTSIYVRCGPRA
jgi:hypothetical protein